MSVVALIEVLESIESEGNGIDEDHEDDENVVTRKWSDLSLVFAPSVPKSDIIYGEEETNMLSFRKRALCLYRKYIEEGSEFEVNIGSKMRQKLRDLMQDGEEWMDEEREVDVVELVTVFDDVMREMIKLLQSSKDRFQSKLKL